MCQRRHFAFPSPPNQPRLAAEVDSGIGHCKPARDGFLAPGNFFETECLGINRKNCCCPPAHRRSHAARDSPEKSHAPNQMALWLCEESENVFASSTNNVCEGGTHQNLAARRRQRDDILVACHARRFPTLCVFPSSPRKKRRTLWLSVYRRHQPRWKIRRRFSASPPPTQRGDALVSAPDGGNSPRPCPPSDHTCPKPRRPARKAAGLPT